MLRCRGDAADLVTEAAVLRETSQRCCGDTVFNEASYLGDGFRWLQPGFTEGRQRHSLVVILHLGKEGVDVHQCWRLLPH